MRRTTTLNSQRISVDTDVKEKRFLTCAWARLESDVVETTTLTHRQIDNTSTCDPLEDVIPLLDIAFNTLLK